MKILFCNYEYPPLGGGGGVLNAWLAEELATRHEVTVLTSGLDAAERVDDQDGVRVIRVPVGFRKNRQAASLASLASYVMRARRRGRELVRAERFDIINTHFVVPTGPVGDHLARSVGIPNVLSVHGGDLYDPSKFTSPHRHAVLRARIRKLLHSADAVVGQSANTVGNVAKFYSTDVHCELIPLGIPRPDMSALAARADHADFEMVTVGRAVARKGLDQLIRLMAMLDLPDARLSIVGDGPALAEVRALADELGVSERIRFLGHVDEQAKLEAMVNADLYVSTSQHEGFGLSYLEGMAAGLPMVSYDEGGHTDFVEEGRTGHVVPLNDLAGFEARVRGLYNDRERLAHMAAHCLELVEKYFIEHCAREYEALFERVLAARSGTLP